MVTVSNRHSWHWLEFSTIKKESFYQVGNLSRKYSWLVVTVDMPVSRNHQIYNSCQFSFSAIEPFCFILVWLEHRTFDLHFPSYLQIIQIKYYYLFWEFFKINFKNDNTFLNRIPGPFLFMFCAHEKRHTL